MAAARATRRFALARSLSRLAVMRIYIFNVSATASEDVWPQTYLAVR